jgi:hypothetical protein
MGHIKTSAIFYRRGVSNNQSNFGIAVTANYPIVQPQWYFIGNNNFFSLNKNIMSLN